LQPGELTTLINAYYETLFKPIRNRQGHISDVVGDAVMAIWADVDNPAVKTNACEAALDILHNIPTIPIPGEANQHLRTRIGLHWGELVMGNVGALDHYEYRAVGDIVNTASRIEGVNKQLGTHVLASEQMLQNVSGINSRFLGNFQMKGKKAAIGLYELLPARLDEAQEKVVGQFNDALSLLHDGSCERAREIFAVNAVNDGPSAFYLTYLQSLESESRLTGWEGIIKLDKK
jgi:adenylate cyclase